MRSERIELSATGLESGMLPLHHDLFIFTHAAYSFNSRLSTFIALKDDCCHIFQESIKIRN